jgi:hypothetical protein
MMSEKRICAAGERTILSLFLLLTVSACLPPASLLSASQFVGSASGFNGEDAKKIGLILRGKEDKKPDDPNVIIPDPDSREELFAREWFKQDSYIFVMLDRTQVSQIGANQAGLSLITPDGKTRRGHAFEVVSGFHKTIVEALDPARDMLSGNQWYTEQHLAGSSWEDEPPPLKKERDRFYRDVNQRLGSLGGRPLERVTMGLPGADGQRKMIACLVVHGGTIHEPVNYLAYIAGVQPAHVRSATNDVWSVRVLDAKLQEYACEAEYLPQELRPGVYASVTRLYTSAVTLYLDSRKESGGSLEGVDFISQYLAATVIGAFQQESQEYGLPVGLFVEMKIRQMDVIDGGRKYVKHRLVDDKRGKELVKALREAVKLVEQDSQGTGEPLARKIQAAQRFSDDVRKSENVRCVLKKYLESVAYLLPEYTQTALMNQSTTAQKPLTGKPPNDSRPVKPAYCPILFDHVAQTLASR